MTKRALVIIANGTEEMEAVISIDILRRAGVIVTVAGLTDIVICSRQVTLVADFTLDQLDSNFDLLVLPGGLRGAQAFQESKLVQSLLKDFENQDKLVGIICASPICLVAQKIFAGRKITSHPSVKSQLDSLYNYQEDRVVVDGNLITSRGPGTTFEFALKLVELLCGTVF